MCPHGITQFSGESCLVTRRLSSASVAHGQAQTANEESEWLSAVELAIKLTSSIVRSIILILYNGAHISETWDGDAFLRVEGNKVAMITETGDK